jgi:superfamily II DNA/RNA helicase
MNIMMELRKCCNHPFLINGAEERIISEFNIGIRPGHPEYKAPGEIMVLSSGKLVLIDKLLPKLKAGGHKVLIFSQMIRCLDILEDYMNSHGYLYERIDGRVRGSLRQAAIDRFSRPDSDRFVFLLCTRAGGLGINLTAADTVIIFDSDWNPQNDLQAQARCHRIGQDKAVKVYRLVTRNTYEREMFDRASMKLGLDRAVLQSMNSGNAAQPQMTKKQVEELLKKGAYGALMDDDTDSAKFCEEDIDQILERRTQVIVLDSEAKGSTFAKASFTSAESHIDIDIDDPDFWEKWAKKAQVDTRRSSRSELILHHPRQRKQTKRYVIGSESHDMADFSDSDPDVDEEQLIPGSKIVQKGYSRAECFKVEKQLLTYGWNRWRDILENGNFKRKMTQRDVEAIARMMCVYCLHCCKPDERIREAVLDILALPSTAEDQYDAEDGRKRRRRKGTKKISRSAAQHFGMQDTAVLLNKDPNTFFEDEGYKKHLQNHANKVLNRVRQLVFLEKDIIGDRADLFLSGVPAGDLDLTVPPAEGDPPAAWWDEAMDLSLLVGVFKFGYEKYAQMYDDPSLCFMERCGRPPTSGKKAEKINKTEEEEEDDEDTHIEDADSQESAAGGDGKDLDTPAYESHRMTTRSDTERGNKPPFPPPADVNTRFRRLIAAFMKLQRKEQSRRLQARKEQQRRQKFEEMVKQKEIRRAEMAQKWSKREEQDFYRTLSSYGVVRDPSSGQYDWSKFRVLAKLEKKGNDRLSRYYEEFLDMCHLVCNKSSGKPGMKHNRTGKFAIDPISEEKASRVIQRVQLLSAIREEILTHPELQTRLQLCQHSFDLPSWWLVGKHDHELLIGVSKLVHLLLTE